MIPPTFTLRLDSAQLPTENFGMPFVIDLSQYFYIDDIYSVKSQSLNTAWYYKQKTMKLHLLKNYENITIEYFSKYMVRKKKLERILQ